MKITRCLTILAVSTLAMASAKAQSQLSGDCSCMAMSPRLRQQTEDNCPIYRPAGGSDYIQGEAVRKGGTRGELIMRSPKAEATDQEVQPRAAIMVDEEREAVGYKATCHGITASPRVHQMLKDQRTTVDLYTVVR